MNADSPRLPIWQSPAWITAIVGLISAFLTVPDVVGNYFSKQQDIELAEQKTKSVKLANDLSKQDQEFQIVNNTLARQGTERVFVLRYLAATLDDDDAKTWAKEEVRLLGEVAKKKDEFEKAKDEYEEKQKQLFTPSNKAAPVDDSERASLEAEVTALGRDLVSKKTAVIQELQVAGISTSSDRTPKRGSFRVYKGRGVIVLFDSSHRCTFRVTGGKLDPSPAVTIDYLDQDKWHRDVISIPARQAVGQGTFNGTRFEATLNSLSETAFEGEYDCTLFK